MEFSRKSRAVLTVVILLFVKNSSAASKGEPLSVNERDICFVYIRPISIGSASINSYCKFQL